MSHLDLDDAEKIKTLIVTPTIEALRAEIQAQLGPIATQVAGHEPRLQSLESNQKKALAAWGLGSLGLSALLTGVWEWAKAKIHWG